MKKMKHLTFFALAALLSTALVSCETEDEVEIGETNVSYTLTLAPDLLKFVTPEVRYVDARGEVVTLTGVDQLDSQVAESGSAGSWTSDTDPETGRKKWTVRMKFKRLDFHSYMTVTYRRNEVTEDTAGTPYDFCHDLKSDIDVKPSTFINHKKNEVKMSGTYSNSYFLPGGEYQGDDIDAYLDELCTRPYKVGYYIDKMANVTQRAEGE